jgi:transcriptional regulator with PAS, ATPase and Fis domain
VIDRDEISETVPRRRVERDTERVGILAVLGGANSLDSFTRGHLVPIGNGLTIGRRPPALPGTQTLAIADRTISSFHARIRRMMISGYKIEDQGSTNGTFIDGRAITGDVELPDGALIFMGAQIFVFRMMTTMEIAAIEADRQDPFAPIPTLSPALALTCSKLRRLAPSATELFLLGETGVGKEVFAHAIHERSGRGGPLLAINCAALPRELVESELFGYERGAHSTAKARKPGLIAAADRGTLFLDELAEMPIDVQSKLLRFLQDRTYTPIGATRPETADVRIIAASSRVAETTGLPVIQEALLGRLGAHPVRLPPLRQRKEDLGRLVAYFLRGMTDGRQFDTEPFEALFLHDWPHNIRELQKVVNEAQLLSQGNPTIGFDHLPPFIGDMVESNGAPTSFQSSASPSSATEGSGAVGWTDGRPRMGPAGTEPQRNRPWKEIPQPETFVRRRRPVPSLAELRTLLREHDGNVSEVARRLDRQWAVVWRTMRRYGITADEFRGPDATTGAAGERPTDRTAPDQRGGPPPGHGLGTHADEQDADAPSGEELYDDEGAEGENVVARKGDPPDGQA